MIGLRGEALVEIDGESHSCREGTFICLTPNHLLSARSRTADFLFEYIAFEYDFLSDFPLLLTADTSDRMGNRPVIQLDAPTFWTTTSYYNFIADRCNDTNHRIEIIKGLLFAFVIEVSQIYSSQGSLPAPLSRKKELADSFFRLLHDYYKTEKGAAFYAGRLCITDKYLFRTVKQVTGNTFHFWVSDFIVREAKILLKSTQRSVTEIAEELNFPNSSFFARFFRKHTGLSPMQFRKK